MKPQFDISLARSLADYSQRAYEGSGGVFIESAVTDTGILLADTRHCTIVACRGTHNLKDWIQDAKFKKISPFPNKGIRVHEGFYMDIESVYGHVVNELERREKPLFITGHSKGGAEAELLAYRLERSSIAVERVYTLAAPRVGNSTWQHCYNEAAGLGPKTFRITASGDLVPHLPGTFTTPLNGYRHVGREIYFEGPGRYREDPSPCYEFIANEWRAAKALQRGDLDFIVNFHSLVNDYIPLLT
jgi:hypothetical protein